MIRFWYALASLVFPGLGQAIAGRRFAAYAWFAIALGLLFGLVLGVWVLAAWLVIRLASAVDAARSAAAPRGFALDIAIVAAGPFAAAIVLRTFVVEAFKAPSSSMCPTLQIGDHVFIDKLAAAPDRGDVVVFRNPCQPASEYVKRVIGLPGDTVEVRCSVLYVNGQPADLALVDAQATYQDYDETDGSWRSVDAARYRETVDGASYDVLLRRDASVDAPDPHDFPLAARHEPPSCAAAPGFGSPDAPAIPSGTIKDVARPGARACDPQLQYVVPVDQVFVLGDNRDNSNDSRYWGSVPVANIEGRAVGIWWSRSLSRLGAVR
jgi:signal peptidase I